MSLLQIKEVDNTGSQELRINKNKGTINADLRVFYIEDGKFMVAYIPGLELSGYGETKDQARSMLEEVIIDYFDTLINLKRDEITRELSQYGWEKGIYQKRFVNKVHVDKQGILNNLELPENTPITESMLEVA